VDGSGAATLAQAEAIPLLHVGVLNAREVKRALRRRIEGAFACFPVVDDVVVAVERGILN
jgi:hypothetical protein